MRQLKFWFEFASPCSYLSAMRIEALAAMADASIGRAQSAEIKTKLKVNMEEARASGIFGAPSFVTESGELFWGDGRLEQALAWSAGCRSAHETQIGKAFSAYAAPAALFAMAARPSSIFRANCIAASESR